MMVIDYSLNTLWSSITIVIYFIEHTTAAIMVNYYCNMFKVESTEATIVNYIHNIFIVQDHRFVDFTDRSKMTLNQILIWQNAAKNAKMPPKMPKCHVILNAMKVKRKGSFSRGKFKRKGEGK